ncbi:MAG: NUDIX domain-containing protein [Bacteriovorax sp.]|nr:NUDIX domain-containing protein [Bacteriovorax sp.]
MLKKKVIAYIFRTKDSRAEVLVFTHRDFPEAGIQVVGGTVESNENFEEALLREIKEESGLVFKAQDILKKLGETQYLRKDMAEINHRNYYELKGGDLPDSWSHTVVSNGLDNSLVFDFFWMPISLAKKELTGNFGELLP